LGSSGIDPGLCCDDLQISAADSEYNQISGVSDQ